MKISQVKFLSLPPAIRDKTEHHVLFFLLPDDIHGMQQKKYYDFVSDFELNELFHVGVEGIKVKVFSTSMDTKGREELLGMPHVGAYVRAPYTHAMHTPCTHDPHTMHPHHVGMQAIQAYHSCPTCMHSWSRGIVRKCDFDGYRRFLLPGYVVDLVLTLTLALIILALILALTLTLALVLIFTVTLGLACAPTLTVTLPLALALTVVLTLAVTPSLTIALALILPLANTVHHIPSPALTQVHEVDSHE